MYDIDTSLLRTFIVLAETRNFTRTAERVHRSQSAVSMQIAKLEELLECSLFERDKRNVRLTHEGEKLRSHANQIVQTSDKMFNEFSNTEVEGNVHFGSPEDFATFYLPGILADFIKVNPRVTLNVNCDLTLSLINEYEKKLYDLIVIKQEPGNLYPGSVPLWKESLVWVGGDTSDRSITFKKTVKNYINDQNALPLVLSPSPCVYRQRALEALDKQGIPWEVVYTSPSFAGTCAAVRAGLGFSVIPRNMVENNLFPLETERGWPKLKNAEMCLLAGSKANPAVNSLIEFIQERISYHQ